MRVAWRFSPAAMLALVVAATSNKILSGTKIGAWAKKVLESAADDEPLSKARIVDPVVQAVVTQAAKVEEAARVELETEATALELADEEEDEAFTRRHQLATSGKVLREEAQLTRAAANAQVIKVTAAAEERVERRVARAKAEATVRLSYANKKAEALTSEAASKQAIAADLLQKARTLEQDLSDEIERLENELSETQAEMDGLDGLRDGRVEAIKGIGGKQAQSKVRKMQLEKRDAKLQVTCRHDPRLEPLP